MLEGYVKENIYAMFAELKVQKNKNKLGHKNLQS